MRSFVALAVPGFQSDALEKVQHMLPSGRKVPPENFHVTLAFMDDQPVEVLDDLHLELEQVRQDGVAVEIAGLNTQGGPAIAFAEVTLTDPLVALQGQVARAARRAGITLERRRFRPHVTLARYRKEMRPEDLDKLGRALQTHAQLRLPAFEPRAFGLYRSTLTSSGAVYDLMAEYPLAHLPF
ncbi:RNA 2',3'-cyclic phosphodiesterase [Fluviibacterium sp. S390]|uniref:RNA 2',3'-cyclic phosphodiesterase n=1 Tax=Fluviibacterium sp. S390 TaxID=3415139 RepID=UPI003C7B978D